MGQTKDIDTIIDIKIVRNDGSITVLAHPTTISIAHHGTDNTMDFTAYDCTVLPDNYYSDELMMLSNKLRTVRTLLKSVSFMLDQYSMPNDKNHVMPFETTQDMAKYFKLMVDMCLKESVIT